MTWPLPAPRRRIGIPATVTGSIVALATLFVVWNLSPWVWFIDTTPTGGDMGAHVWAPAYLRDELLPNWRVTGWSPDWYSGFPAFTFYMIVPSLLIVIVNVGVDIDVNTLSFIGLALGVSEVSRRLRLGYRARMIAVASSCALGIALSTWWDGDRFDFDRFGWSPIEAFTYNDRSIDLAISALVLPAAVASLVWHLARGLGRWRGVVTTVAVLATLLIVPVPYGVAMKLVVVAGLVSLPVAAYAAGRLGGLAFPGPALLAVMTLPFLFDRSYNIYGGNLMSTMAGEFAYSLGLAVAVLYLGVAARGVATGRDRTLAAALLALAGLTHLFAAFFALVGTVALFLLRPGRRQIGWLVVAGPLAGLLSAFWVLPFVWNRGLLNDMGWGKERRYVAALWDRSGRFGDQDFLVNDPPLQIFVVLAIVGAVVCGLRRVRFGMALSLVAMMFAAGFLLLPEGRLWNVRILPFYYLSVFFMAGIAVSEVGRWVVELLRSPDPARAPRQGWGAAAPAVVTTLVVLTALAFPLRSVPFASSFTQVDDEGNGVSAYGFSAFEDVSTTQLNFGPGWLRYNFSGYEQKPGTVEYTDMVATMGQVGEEFGCGRSLWEFESARLGSYGTTMAPMLLPHWTDGCIGSMEGLYFEASATTPYHFLLQSELSAAPSRAQRDLPYSPLDVDKGVDGMRALGVRYYQAFSEEAVAQARAHPDLEEIATSGPWVIFLLADHELVTGLDHLPVVLDGVDAGGEEWLIPTVAAWEAGPDVSLIAGDGADDWPRMSLQELEEDPVFAAAGGDRVSEMRALAAVFPDWLDRVEVEPAVVSDVVSDNSSISFRVDRVGSPVLVRTSYFPNWTASGADGPWRVAPNLMVVVPTEADVELSYGRSSIELVSIGLTVIGLAGLVVVSRRPIPTDGRAAWDFSAPPLDMPEGAQVRADARDGTLDHEDLEQLRWRLQEQQYRAFWQAGLALVLAGSTLLVGLFVDAGADRPIASIVVFGPLAVGLVLFLFGAAPVLLRVGTYRHHVIGPSLLMLDVRADAEAPFEDAAPGPPSW